MGLRDAVGYLGEIHLWLYIVAQIEEPGIDPAQSEIGPQQVLAELFRGGEGELVEVGGAFDFLIHAVDQGLEVELFEIDDFFDLGLQNRLPGRVHRADTLGPGDEVGKGDDGHQRGLFAGEL